jgi:hypothetical protein
MDVGHNLTLGAIHEVNLSILLIFLSVLTPGVLQWNLPLMTPFCVSVCVCFSYEISPTTHVDSADKKPIADVIFHYQNEVRQGSWTYDEFRTWIWCRKSTIFQALTNQNMLWYTLQWRWFRLITHPLNFSQHLRQDCSNGVRCTILLNSPVTYVAIQKWGWGQNFKIDPHEDPVVRIDSLHPHACRKRRLNGADFRMRPEKLRSRVTVGVAR